MPGEEAMRRQDDYERGLQAAKIQALQETVERILQELKDHRAEEQATWDRFEKSLSDLLLWRARIAGIAAGVACVVSVGWHLLVNVVKWGK